MTARGSQPRPVSVRDFVDRKGGEKLVMVSAYDALFARLCDEAGVDAVLVGDSLGNVIAGYRSTLPVTLEQMIYHGAAVRRGTTRAMVIVDMPFMSYQVSVEQALANCGRVMKETECHAVKVEGGSDATVAAVHALVSAGIPVMGHVGFTPQSVHALGGPRVQGREPETAQRVLREASRLEEAGCFSVVLELVPRDLAREATQAIRIPTIGIGAGPDCDGQVLVLYDLLGLNDRFKPRYLKEYASMAEDVRRAVGAFRTEVTEGRYPDEEHSF